LGDILGQLGIPNAHVVRGSIDRDNLIFEVPRTVNRQEKEEGLLSVIARGDKPGIVYAATVKCVNELHEWLVGRANGGVTIEELVAATRISENESG